MSPETGYFRAGSVCSRGTGIDRRLELGNSFRREPLKDQRTRTSDCTTGSTQREIDCGPEASVGPATPNVRGIDKARPNSRRVRLASGLYRGGATPTRAVGGPLVSPAPTPCRLQATPGGGEDEAQLGQAPVYRQADRERSCAPDGRDHPATGRTVSQTGGDGRVARRWKGRTVSATRASGAQAGAEQCRLAAPG